MASKYVERGKMPLSSLSLGGEDVSSHGRSSSLVTKQTSSLVAAVRRQDFVSRLLSFLFLFSFTTLTIQCLRYRNPSSKGYEKQSFGESISWSCA